MYPSGDNLLPRYCEREKMYQHQGDSNHGRLSLPRIGFRVNFDLLVIIGDTASPFVVVLFLLFFLNQAGHIAATATPITSKVALDDVERTDLAIVTLFVLVALS
jgi:hypothetical protein